MNARWFKLQLDALGLSQRQFAKRMNLDPSAITLILQGKRQLKTEEVSQMASLFGVEIAEVLAKAGVRVSEGPVKASDVVLKGFIGDDLKVVRWAKPSDLKRIQVKGFSGKGFEALRLATAGTKFEGMDGGLVIYKPRPGVDPEATGRLSVVTTGEGTFLRVLRRGYSLGTYNLTSLSGDLIKSDVEIDSAWQVLDLRF